MSKQVAKRTHAEPTLFEHHATQIAEDAPLAERVRPHSLQDVVGQEQLLGPGRPLGEAIRTDRLTSMILWGPPGSGKTTLARVIARATKAQFVMFNAVLQGVADLRRVVDEAEEALRLAGQRTILFVDEIHRFNRSQQDAFLPHVERGTIILIGATTENPAFSLSRPLLSRARVYRLQALAPAAIQQILRRALAPEMALDADAEAEIIRRAEGDGRLALGLLEMAQREAMQGGSQRIELTQIGAGQERTLNHDRAGDQHYDVISALIKSMRASDPDAAIYWAMRMLEAGDEPLFVLRRLLIFASEDIGNADPRALTIASDADQAFRRLGMPEGIYPIAQAVLYLATAPKSRAVSEAWQAAQAAVRDVGSAAVPAGLEQGSTAEAPRAGACLPIGLRGQRFYQPVGIGYERWIRDRLDGEAQTHAQSHGGSGPRSE